MEVIRCAFCGALESRQMTAATQSAKPIQTTQDEGFVFDSGRFQGETLASVVAHPSGKQYLEWAKLNVDRWRGAITEFLDNAATSA